MASPTKRSGSDNWYFRKRIPADVQDILSKVPRAQRPPNWHRDQITISLKTADRATAKARYAEVAAEVERTMAALRAGPKPLTVKQISALSGELYRAFAEGLEGEPVLTAEQWVRVAELNEQARKGEYGAVARLITGAALSDTVRFRNGNLFDLRRSNLAVVPRSLIAAARRPVSAETGDVQLRDGRWRARRKQKAPSARRRLEAILADTLMSAAH